MRKALLILSLISIFNVGSAQDYSLISAGINFPVKYSAPKPERRLGLELGYSRGYKIKENLFLEGGITIDLWGRWNMKSLYGSITYSYINPNVEFPFLINYRIGRFGIKNGVDIYGRNLFRITKSKNGDGVSSYYPGSEYMEDVQRSFGVAYHFAVSYSLTTKFDLYADYRTSIISIEANRYGLRGNRYGLLNFGIAYRFAHK